MIDAIELIKRIAKGEELTWEEVDQNWQLIETAVNALIASTWQQDYNTVPAGIKTITHNFGMPPLSVTVWQKVTADRWVPVATPDVSYLDAEVNEKLYINFPDAPGTIRVIVKF